ncbi:MAG: SCO family protein [Alphaproteobacteria bacterium]|nr:SCO family protein [Alphaproteobacteria bacterium]
MVLRLIRFTAIGLILMLLGALGYMQWFRPGSLSPDRAGGLVTAAEMQIGGPFALTDHTGRAVTDQTYRGRWMVLFFGFTHCPDVCPTELATVAEALGALGPDAGRVAPLFVSIDPERDTPAALAQYVTLYDPRLTGLTGTAEQVSVAARAYRVFYRKVEPPGSSTYLMDHSALTYLMDPDGRLAAIFRPGTTATDMAAAIKAHIARRGG